jgi:hypothetical protein
MDKGVYSTVIHKDAGRIAVAAAVISAVADSNIPLDYRQNGRHAITCVRITIATHSS